MGASISNRRAIDRPKRSFLLRISTDNTRGGDNSVFIDAIQLQTASGAVVGYAVKNGGFEEPVQSDPYRYVAPGFTAGWLFESGNLVYIRQYSAFGNGNPPEGQQSLALQGTAAISQTVRAAPGRYRLVLLATGRTNNGDNYLPLTISINGTAIYTVTPQPLYDTYQSFATPYFTI